MAEHKDVLEGLLTTLYQKDSTAVASLYTDEAGVLRDDAFDVIKSWDAERVGSIKGSVDEIKKEQYNHGLRKGLDDIEKAIRRHGVKSDKKGVELVQEVLELKTASAEVNDDTVKTHRLYRALEEQLQGKDAEWSTKLESEKSAWTAEHQRKETLASVYDHAIGMADSLKVFGLPKDPAKRKTFLLPLFSKLDGYGYQAHESNGKRTFLPLNSDGGRLENNHGHQVPLDSLIEGIIKETYDLDPSDGRTTTDAIKKRTEADALVELPTGDAELAEFMFKMERDPSVTPERRKQVMAAIKARNKQ